MIHIILYQPEIPPNTGNIIRLCANTGASLHLIQPLGFKLEDKNLKRAGLDYHEFANIREYPDLPTCINKLNNMRIFACSTKAKNCYADIQYQPGDAFLFGPETTGLPIDVLESLPLSQRIRIPMLPQSRSLNLSNSVAVILYEAWRQQKFLNGI